MVSDWSLTKSIFIPNSPILFRSYISTPGSGEEETYHDDNKQAKIESFNLRHRNSFTVGKEYRDQALSSLLELDLSSFGSKQQQMQTEKNKTRALTWDAIAEAGAIKILTFLANGKKESPVLVAYYAMTLLATFSKHPMALKYLGNAATFNMALTKLDQLLKIRSVIRERRVADMKENATADGFEAFDDDSTNDNSQNIDEKKSKGNSKGQKKSEDKSTRKKTLEESHEHFTFGQLDQCELAFISRFMHYTIATLHGCCSAVTTAALLAGSTPFTTIGHEGHELFTAIVDPAIQAWEDTQAAEHDWYAAQEDQENALSAEADAFGTTSTTSGSSSRPSSAVGGGGGSHSCVTEAAESQHKEPEGKDCEPGRHCRRSEAKGRTSTPCNFQPVLDVFTAVGHARTGKFPVAKPATTSSRRP